MRHLTNELNEIKQAYDFYSEKYGPDHWQHTANAKGKCYSAIMKHLSEWRTANPTDKRTGPPILPMPGHACSILCGIAERADCLHRVLSG